MLESRRQLVETATQEFERAVSNIVQTLDRAAGAMGTDVPPFEAGDEGRVERR